MKASLQLRFSQHLALTPQLQQSIRLLQLSTLELAQEVATAIAQNPLLENEDDWTTSALRVAPDGSLISTTPQTSAPDTMERTRTSDSSERNNDSEPNGADDFSGMNHGSDQSDTGGEGDDASSWNLDDYARPGSSNEEDDAPALQLHGSQTSLRDHLLAQLRMTKASLRDRALVTFLIESLDDDGYLASPLEEVMADLPEELDIDLDEINAALALLHSFDPPGVAGAQVGARDRHASSGAAGRARFYAFAQAVKDR